MEHLTQTTAGTLAYMTPELFAGEPVTKAADLYAVGVMAYELFAGRFPYNQANVAVLLTDILTKFVDVRSIGVGDELAAVLERLLVKSREERYSDAGEVIRDLCAATGCAAPPETVEIRESYLQAARFVGRETELGRLSEALEATLAGRGSAWLVGGESGVGKSRLADELRTLALVRGAQVPRGQAISKGGSPYHLWRDVLRWLALTSDLAEEEASVLKPLVPDIADLVGFDVPDLPSLDPEVTQARLLWVVSEVFGRQDRPVVVILEDLQWAGSESLAMLDRLTQGVRDLPLLLIGTYRDDEQPHLPEVLPRMQVLKLERLTKQGVAELSVSMLGEVGRREPVVRLLQRETEGNPFFLVEVVRALAEEAGQLERVGVMTLPATVFAAGVWELVQRRLDRVPEGARPLLRLAAVAGRELDLDVLWTLAPEVDLERWLATCADVAVLEVDGEQWRFAHNMLREGILDALTEEVLSGLHRKVAETLERSFPERAKEQAGIQAHLWERAEESEKAIEYLLRAGEQARAAYANEEAIAYFRRALALLDRFPPEASVADPWDASRKRWRLGAAKELGQIQAYLGGAKSTEAEDYLRQAITLGKEIGLAPRELVRLYYWLEEALFWQGPRGDDLIRIAEEGLALLGDDTESVEAALMNHQAARGYLNKGNRVKFQELAHRTAQFLRRLPYSEELRPVYSHMWFACREERNVEEGLKWLQLLEEKATSYRDLMALGNANLFRGTTLAQGGELHGAISLYPQALEQYTRAGSAMHTRMCLYWMIETHLSLGSLLKAEAYVHKYLETAKAMGDNMVLSAAHELMGRLSLCQGMWVKAADAFRKAIHLGRGKRARSQEAEVTELLGRAYLAQGDQAEAVGRFQRVVTLMELEEMGQFPLVFARVLSGLEEAYRDPVTYRASCRQFRQEHPESDDSPFVQWYLEPACAGALHATPLRDDFITDFSPGWDWHDPFDDCSFTVQNGLEIYAANGRDLWDINWSAPRILRSASRDLAVQTIAVPVSGERPAIGGILLWKDEENYIRLDRGVFGEHQVTFMGCVDNADVVIGRGRLYENSERVYLRLERRGDRVNAFCSADGEQWFTAGHAAFPVEDPVQVGVHAIGNIDRTIHHGAYPEGTAIRFESFQLWGM
jgi:tetratricopeptide (TPR) repeat protein